MRYICGSLSIAIDKPAPFVTINGVFHSHKNSLPKRAKFSLSENLTEGLSCTRLESRYSASLGC